MEGYQPTYEELKPRIRCRRIAQKIRYQPTYEELKHFISSMLFTRTKPLPAYL